jgi:hypothetical protein
MIGIYNLSRCRFRRRLEKNMTQNRSSNSKSVKKIIKKKFEIEEKNNVGILGFY